ncbi:hypothetical protein AB0J80_13385 [Actinoplanes sp. NPDC049548]|uniref:hypothetical protein n=1 Tax=Actinoplanes sp. NPDC049548 TaxID=3155152 RepID=UPI00343923DA
MPTPNTGKSCAYCSGTGRMDRKCTQCGGTGVNGDYRNNRCGACTRGYQQHPCPRCGGSGRSK